MADWILLDNGKEEGIAVAFNSSEVSFKTTNRSPFFIGNGLDEEEFKDLYNCASLGGKLAYDLMWREGYIKTGVTARFTLTDCPPNIRGRSAELMFGIAVLKLLHPQPNGYSEVAATGVLNEETCTIDGVKGVASKIRAALKVLAKGAVIFVPKANEADIGSDLYLQAEEIGIDLIPITSLAEAARILGISIEKVYLDNPYLGLQAFNYEHNHIYFGREATTQKLCKQLKEREEKGRPGALVIGSSGSGKSSLIQAGLLPSLTKGMNSLQDRPVTWTLWTPSSAQGRNEPALLQSLYNVWPINFQGLPPATTLLELGENIGKALTANRRLLWNIDQMEELFTLGFDEQVINAFGQFLQSLQKAGVWVIATLRSDFYKDYLNHSSLLAVFNDDGQFNLPPLDAGSLRLIIERPAELANVRFEVDDDGISLAERLRQDMDDSVEALPLLEFALQQLFERMDDQRQMTFSAYKEIGELKGAIGSYADAIYQNLREDEQAALPKVLRALTTCWGEASSFTAQPLNINHFPKNSPEQSLIDKLVNHRLLINENDNFRVSHEALLSHWQTANKALNDSIKSLEIRGRISSLANRWIKEKENSDMLLNSGLPLEEAKWVLTELDGELNLNAVAYINASITVEEKKRSKEKYQRRLRMAIVTTVAIFMTSFAIYSWNAKRKADNALSVAKMSVEEFYLIVSEDTLLNEPSVEPLRVKLLTKANESYKTLANYFSDNVDTQQRLADSYYRLAYLKRNMSDLNGSKQDFQEYLNIVYSLTHNQKNPSAIYISKLAEGYSALGIVSKGEEAYNSFLKAIQLYEKLSLLFPENQDYLDGLARTLINLSTDYEESAERAKAIEYTSRAISISEKIVNIKPNTATYQLTLLTGYRNLGSFYLRDKNIDIAIKIYEKSIKIAENLVSIHQEPEYQNALGTLYISLGMAMETAKDKDGTKNAGEMARKIYEGLVKNHPDVTEYSKNLTISNKLTDI